MILDDFSAGTDLFLPFFRSTGSVSEARWSVRQAREDAMEQISTISKEEWTLGIAFRSPLIKGPKKTHMVWLTVPAGLIELDDGNIETGKPSIFDQWIGFLGKILTGNHGFSHEDHGVFL